MAKIFVALYNFCRLKEDYCAMPPFFESFLNGLADAGNDVRCFQTKKTVNRGFDAEIPQKYYEFLRDFNPDLCILFNNSFWDVSHIVDCPIIIYDVDSPLEWQLKENLKANSERYLYVYCQTQGKQTLIDKFGVPKTHCRYIPFFTEIQANQDQPLRKSVVFLGTNWIWHGYDFLNNFICSSPANSDVEKAKEVLSRYKDIPLEPAYKIYYELQNRPHDRINFGDLRRCALEVSGYRRIKFLSAVTDLGLEIYGQYWDISAMNYYPDVLFCVRNKKIWTKSDNETLYNESRIALNTKHIHAVSGFSFRVCDILASNACLVSEESTDLLQLFPDVGIPFFTSPAEARDQCVKLLNNENLRRDIVSRAHEEIDKHFRFKNVLESLEDFTGITLHGGVEGNLTIFPASEEEAKNELVHKISSLSALQIGYYNTLGKHLGYDPYNRFKKKNIFIGKIPILKILYPTSTRKEVYMGCLPILSYNQEKGKSIIHNLLLEKIMRGLKKAKQYLIIKMRLFRFMPRNRRRLAVIRKKLLSGEKIRICLFVSRINCWMFEDIYRILKESGKFEPVIVVKPLLSRGTEHMKESMSSAYAALVERGYSPIKGYDEETDTYFDVRGELDPDIVFYTKFWKPHFHPNFYIDMFRDRMTLLIDYGYNVTGHKEAMNFELQNMVDMYFYYTPIQKEIAARYMWNEAKNVVISGSPKLDRVFDESYIPVDAWKAQERQKKRVIWAPHHEDRTQKNMYQLDAFYDLYEVMLEIAEQYKDSVQFAFKPHPVLKVKLYDKWGAEATDAYYDVWRSMENGQLEEGEFIDLFLTSDAMIMDCLSFIAEYTATNKPALFTVGSKSRVLLNDLGDEIYQMLYHAKDDLKNEICAFIEKVVIGEKDEMRERRTEFIRRYIMPPNNKSAAENVYDCIYNYIERGGRIDS